MVHPELFHYTSVSAMKKILDSNTLWATRITHLNDSSEMKLVWPRIEKYCVCYLNKYLHHHQQNPVAKKTLDDADGIAELAKKDGATIVRTISDVVLGRSPVSEPPFVVSFTTHGSKTGPDKYHRSHGMLSQWRGYGSDAGVALVFDRKKIEELLEQEGQRFDFWPCLIDDAVYDKEGLDIEKQFPELHQALQALGELIEAFGQDDGQTISQILNKNVLPKCVSAAGRFKHKAFYEEQECRIIVGVLPKPASDSSNFQESLTNKKSKQIHHRAGNCGAIPYIRLFENPGNLPITRIIVGPHRNQLAHLEEVQELTRTRRIKVEKSEIPYVGST